MAGKRVTLRGLVMPRRIPLHTQSVVENANGSLWLLLLF